MISWCKIAAFWKTRQQGPTAPSTSAQVQLLLGRISASSCAGQVRVYLMHVLKYPHAMKSQDTWCTGHCFLNKIIFGRLLV